ncbi:hypothetical protein HDU86_004073 [Geranomyces michiganensis]|nr:hypothetical protein HDU86_004073 [Geranomyces michiganensis]
MRITLLAVLATTAGTAFAQVFHTPQNTIWENLVAYNQDVDSGVNTYHMSVVNKHAAALKDLLSGPGPFTVFFPSDHSFDAIRTSEPEYYQQLTTDNALMTATLRYFVTQGVYDIFKNPPPRATLPSIVAGSSLQALIVPPAADAPAGWVASSITANGDPTEVYIVHTMPSSNGILYVTGFSHVLHAPPEALAAAAQGGIVPRVSASASRSIAASTAVSTAASSSTVSPRAPTQTASVFNTTAVGPRATAPATSGTATGSFAASTAPAAAGGTSSGAVTNTFSAGGLVAAFFALFAL